MAVESIWTPVQEGDVAGNHFLVTPREVSFGEMDSIPHLNHFSQKIGPCPETLDNAGNLLPTGTRAPEIVGLRRLAGGFRIFNDSDLRWLLYLRFNVSQVSLLVPLIVVHYVLPAPYLCDR